MKKVISVIVKNEHGVLARIVNLFAGRGYNIESLTVAPVPDSNFSRMTISTEGDEHVFEQIAKQLNKLLPVLKVIESEKFVEKEMVMVKLPLDNPLSDIDVLAKSYNGEITNVGKDYVIIFAVDTIERVGHFLEAISNYNPVEIVRSGATVIER
jgi:acetolactate synthase-1/3 small subunit